MRNNRYSNLKMALPAHREKLDSFIEGRITAPVYVRVKPINVCQHACSWCVYKSDRKAGQRDDSHMASVPSSMHSDMKEADVMPAAKMMETLVCFAKMGVKAVTFSGGGEPLLHKDIARFMSFCLTTGIDLSIITNGQLLKGPLAEILSMAKWVRVSMDYTTAAQMAHTRVVPERMFDEVLNNLQTFARIKQPGCDLAVNYIVHRDNCEGLFEFAARLYSLGVENIRFSPMYCDDFVAYHTPIKDRVEAQLREIQSLLAGGGVAGEDARQPRAGGAVLQERSVNTTYDLHAPAHSPERKYTRCYYMQTVPVVGADQNVYACHNKAYDKTGLIGSIQEQSFEQLWFSDAAKAVFERLNPQCDCKHQCANDDKNRNVMGLITSSEDNFV